MRKNDTMQRGKWTKKGVLQQRHNHNKAGQREARKGDTTEEKAKAGIANLALMINSSLLQLPYKKVL